jgi:type IV secretory pathway TraG/TraD family ATPase VirD4
VNGRPPYWTVAALVALLAVPVTWLPAAAVGVALAVSAVRAVRSLAARRQARAAHASGAAIALGTDARGRAVAIAERELAAHGLILGASGAGKTTTLLTILCEQVRRGQPVVAIDMKGSPAFAAALADAATHAGRPLRIWTPDGEHHWNPLAHGNATELKDKLIATERFTEPHYQRAAERYVQTVLQVLEASHPERPPTLGEVVRLMDPHRLAGSLREIPRNHAERVQDYLAGLTHDQLSAVRGLQTRLAIITESHTGRFLEPAGGSTDIDVRSALSGREVALFSLNSSTYGKLAAQLGTLAVQDLVCAAGHRLSQGAREPATVAIDEASVIGENLISLFARSREAGIGVLAATQELADFDRVATGLRDQVLGNTAFKVAHRQDVPSSAQTVAQMAGTEKRWEYTEQLGGVLPGGYRSGRGTRRLGEQFVIHPNEIKTLRTGQAVLVSKLRGDRASTVSVAAPRRSEGPPSRGGPSGGGASRGGPELA